jgi:hypothetical protein
VTTTDITAEIAVEDLIRLVPRAPAVLRARGLVCLHCGEPVWGTLGELAAARGIDDLAPIIAALERARNGSPRE